jgi:hypothetical protein
MELKFIRGQYFPRKKGVLPEVLFLEFPPECKTSKRNEQFSLGGG